MIINALVFARYNSSRYPGKVLKILNGKPVIQHCIDKLNIIAELKVIVATSVEMTDKPIWDWCEENEITYYKGALDDVALRTKECLLANPCDAFFRVNADSPFLQPELYMEAIRLVKEIRDLDLVTNIQNRTYPYGISVELIRSKTFLDIIDKYSDTEREHVTSYFYDKYKKFNIFNILAKQELNFSRERWVIDTKDDFEALSLLAKRYPGLMNYNLEKLSKIK